MDPAVVNLTDFETFFPEKRPFFVEGAQIFDNFGRNGANNYYGFMRTEPDLFYTRRIGRAPQGGTRSPSSSSVPSATTILGAAKFTGKSASGWSVGVLEAVTGREQAQWKDGETRGRQEVEPLTNYFVLRANRDRTRAGYGALLTAVNRDLGDPLLASQLARSAYVAGLDGYVFLDAAKDWVVSGRVASSQVAGDREAIEGLQLGSARYFQRPDRPEPRLDPTLTALGGWTGSVNLNRQSGAGAGERRRLGHEPRLRVERPRLQPAQRPLGRARRGASCASPSRTASRGSAPSRVAKSYAYNFDGDKQGDARQRLRAGASSATTGTRASTARSAGAGSTTARRAAGPP